MLEIPNNSASSSSFFTEILNLVIFIPSQLISSTNSIFHCIQLFRPVSKQNSSSFSWFFFSFVISFLFENLVHFHLVLDNVIYHISSRPHVFQPRTFSLSLSTPLDDDVNITAMKKLSFVRREILMISNDEMSYFQNIQ